MKLSCGGDAGFAVRQRGRQPQRREANRRALQRPASAGIGHQQVFVRVVVHEQDGEILRAGMRHGMQLDADPAPVRRPAGRHDVDRGGIPRRRTFGADARDGDRPLIVSAYATPPPALTRSPTSHRHQRDNSREQTCSTSQTHLLHQTRRENVATPATGFPWPHDEKMWPPPRRRSHLISRLQSRLRTHRGRPTYSY